MLAEIVEVCVQETFFHTDGSIDEQAMALVAFVHGKYRGLGKELGFFGYSVASEQALKRRMPVEKTADRAAGAKGRQGQKTTIGDGKRSKRR